MTSPTKYPLAWPNDVQRTERPGSSQFRTGLSGALANVKKSIKAFGAETGVKVSDIILSSNVGGLDSDAPSDPGVAAWFTWDGQQRCVAVDRYAKVEDNLQAIHHILEARRTEMRHGGLNIVRQTFRSFTALPAPPGSAQSVGWRAVMGLQGRWVISLDEVERTYREKARQLGEGHSGLLELNVARDASRKELAA